MATNKNKEPVVVLDDKEFKVSDLSEQQQYIHSHVIDLRNQRARLQYQLDQVNAGLNVFETSLLNSVKEQAEEVLSDDKSEGEKYLKKFKIDIKKDAGKFKKSWGKTVEKIDETSKKLRQQIQKIKGEKVTESGVSKGKDLKK